MPFKRIQNNNPTISYEFFPPKTPKGWAALYQTLGTIGDISPDFVSVTYGAGGTTRDKTVSLVARIENELNIGTMAHLTCVDHSKAEIAKVLDTLVDNNVKAIMALRGDPPQGADGYVAHPDGFAHASDLIAFIKEKYDFAIGCACYPEKHQEAESLTADIKYLKLKQDAGADFSVTQLFFDNEIFYRFRKQAIAAGVTMPIIAGIMSVTNKKQLARFEAMSGCSFPKALVSAIHEATDDQVEAAGIKFAIKQCKDLLDNGIAGIHLYTLNKSNASYMISEGLKDLGYFKDELRCSV